MRQITPQLTSLDTQLGNVWLLTDPLGPKFLIDSGHALERLPLLAQLWQAGIRMPGDLTAILLTHRHPEHAGNAAFFRKRFGAKIIAHENEEGILSGRISPPKMLKSREEARESGKQFLHQKLMAAYQDFAPAHCEIDETITQGYWKWGFHFIHTPGHTEGSTMIFHEPTRTLFSGDSITCSRNLITKKTTLQFADPAYSSDAKACHLAVQRYLRQLQSEQMPPVSTLCPGRGPWLDTQAQTKLLRLLPAL